MIYYFRDTHFERLHKFGCFWAPARHRLKGEVFRGALQVYVVLPRVWLERGTPDYLTRWADSENISSRGWTGRNPDREFRWCFDPGYLQIELRTPCRWRWSWRTGRAL